MGNADIKISIITVCYNAEETIEKCLISVINQTYKNVEIIIIDGSSNDGTAAIIEKYRKFINIYKSEPDKGIYDAMNKGIELSSGDYLYFLGADDQLTHEETIFSVVKHLTISRADLLFGKIVFTNGEVVESELSFLTCLHNTVHHQSAFYHRKLFENFRYDPELKLIADYELNLKVFIQRGEFNIVQISDIVATCFSGGRSRSSRWISVDETNFVRRKLMSKFFYTIGYILYTLKRKVGYAVRYYRL